MNALFLGGNSLRHQAWIHEMADALGKPFDTVVAWDYRHWETGDAWIDMDFETSRVATAMHDLSPYIVYAKSIGTMVTLRAMAEGQLQPKACVFLGLPLNAAIDMNLPIEDWLSRATVPLYFLHNADDPYGSAEELLAMLPSNIDPSRVTVLPGTTHDYNDVATMQAALDVAQS